MYSITGLYGSQILCFKLHNDGILLFLALFGHNFSFRRKKLQTCWPVHFKNFVFSFRTYNIGIT